MKAWKIARLRYDLKSERTAFGKPSTHCGDSPDLLINSEITGCKAERGRIK